MPAIHYSREPVPPISCQPGTSRHIECPLSRQPLQQQQSICTNAKAAAGADSAIRSEKAGAHIPIVDPCAEKPLRATEKPSHQTSVQLNNRRVRPVPVAAPCFA